MSDTLDAPTVYRAEMPTLGVSVMALTYRTGRGTGDPTPPAWYRRLWWTILSYMRRLRGLW